VCCVMVCVLCDGVLCDGVMVGVLCYDVCYIMG